jgi:hypothetical protein
LLDDSRGQLRQLASLIDRLVGRDATEHEHPGHAHHRENDKTQRDERKHRSPDGIAAVPHT